VIDRHPAGRHHDKDRHDELHRQREEHHRHIGAAVPPFFADGLPGDDQLDEPQRGQEASVQDNLDGGAMLLE